MWASLPPRHYLTTTNPPLASPTNPPSVLPQSCGGLVKPGIVFFGESLPERFHDRAAEDFPAADLLVVMGTSLVVHPFAGLVSECACLKGNRRHERGKAGGRQRRARRCSPAPDSFSQAVASEAWPGWFAPAALCMGCSPWHDLA